MIRTIPKKKKCKKAEWLYEEVLQIAEKRREAKGKGEKKRYTHLNAEFQSIARRDKKVFLSDQCKEIEENNRMGKTRDGPPGSSVHGIFQARELEWGAISFSRDLPDPGIKLMSLMSPTLAGEFCTTSTTWEARPQM